MIQARKLSSTSYPVVFLMIDSADHVTGKTGLTLTVTLSKNGGAFGSASGAVTELANGWYSLAANATDRNTAGSVALHASASGADPCDLLVNIVDYDPFEIPLEMWGYATRSLTDKVNYGLTSAYDASKAAASQTSVNAIPTSPLLSSDSRLNNLDVGISTRLASAGYTAPPSEATIAAAVWAAGTRTLSSFGSLVSDIWAYTGGRVLSSFGFTVATNSDGNVSAIKAKTDNLPNSPAANGDAMALTTSERGFVASAVWSSVVRTLTSGGGGGGGASAAEIWSYITRTLTSSQPAVSPAVGLQAGTISAWRGDSFSNTVSGMGTLENYSSIYFTVKYSQMMADSASTLQVVKRLSGEDGLLILNGAEAADADHGAILIADLSGGDITIVLAADVMKVLDPGVYRYDVQIIRSTGALVSTLAVGDFVVMGDVTRAVV